MPPSSPYFAELRERSDEAGFGDYILYDGNDGVGTKPRDTATEVSALLRDGFLLEPALVELADVPRVTCGEYELLIWDDNLVTLAKPASFPLETSIVLMMITVLEDCTITKVIGRKLPPVMP